MENREKLIPPKGASLRKYQKRKRPDEGNTPVTRNDDVPHVEDQNVDHISYSPMEQIDEENDEITFELEETTETIQETEKDTHLKNTNTEEKKESQGKSQIESKNIKSRNVTDDITDSTNARKNPTWVLVSEEILPSNFISIDSDTPEYGEDDEIIEICQNSTEFQMSAENILPRHKDAHVTDDKFKPVFDMLERKAPDTILWPSVLTALEEASDFDELVVLCKQLKDKFPPVKPRVKAVFCPGTDIRDNVAQQEIPADGPRQLNAVHTYGDGNCLTRSLGRGYFNKDSYHIEIRARIIIEGVINMRYYLMDEYLQQGATFIHIQG